MLNEVQPRPAEDGEGDKTAFTFVILSRFVVSYTFKHCADAGARAVWSEMHCWKGWLMAGWEIKRSGNAVDRGCPFEFCGLTWSSEW